jgi:hypothetical protein
MEVLVKYLLPLSCALLLAGCYNPRYPSEGPGTDRPDQAAVGSSTGAPVTDSSGQPVQSSRDRRR